MGVREAPPPFLSPVSSRFIFVFVIRDSVGAWNGLPLTQKKNGQMSFLGTYEINYKMAASDGKCLISTILRAAVCKYRLGCAK